MVNRFENSKKLKNVKKASSVKNTQTIKKGQSLTPNPKLGINISDVNYFSTEYPFVDLMKMSSGFNLDKYETL